MFSDFSIEIEGRANTFGTGKDISPAPDGGGGLFKDWLVFEEQLQEAS